MKNNKSSAINTAFKYLSYCARSEKELRDNLLEKEFSPEETEEAISRLKNLNYINDSQYTSNFVSSRSKNKPEGKKLLIMELRKKGVNIDPDVLDINEDELANKALKKKKVFKNKIQAQRFLYSRGFSSSVIERALRSWYNNAE
jgi:SOS response regulatory protein OraA/RecX